MAITLEVEGLKEILDKLKKAENTAKLIEPLWRGVGNDIVSQEGLQRYPPESEANQPRPGGWYQRGYGPRWYGGKGGARTSEQLGKKWSIDPGAEQVTISNAASYAAYVHGEWQAGFHAARGWRQLKTVAEEMMPKIVEGIQRQLARILGNA